MKTVIVDIQVPSGLRVCVAGRVLTISHTACATPNHHIQSGQIFCPILNNFQVSFSYNFDLDILKVNGTTFKGIRFKAEGNGYVNTNSVYAKVHLTIYVANTFT